MESSTKTPLLLVNFGGPRHLDEIAPFLQALLTDREVIHSHFPNWLHTWFFGRLAKKRAKRIKGEYERMGGRSPIWEDTEWLADALREALGASVITFHRYLPTTHAASLKAIAHSECQEIHVFPLFPQFSYATTGSAARFFAENLPAHLLNKLLWVKSYATHPAFLHVMEKHIKEFLKEKTITPKEAYFLFSAHGLPRTFVEKGDPYAKECHHSYAQLLSRFPGALGELCYQSRFGPEEWLRPYTEDVCNQLKISELKSRHVFFVPLSFPSDHIETLVEVEHQYLPLLCARGFNSFRIPALNRRPDWVQAIVSILTSSSLCTTSMLVRKKAF